MPFPWAAVIGAGISAAGAGASKGAAEKKSRELMAMEGTQGAAERLGAPGAEPEAYTRLALRRALFEGLGAGKTTNDLGAFAVPPEMQQYVPQFGPGIQLDPARAEIMNRLSNQNLDADLQRRRQVEDTALQTALNPPKGPPGFWGKLGGAMKPASLTKRIFTFGQKS